MASRIYTEPKQTTVGTSSTLVWEHYTRGGDERLHVHLSNQDGGDGGEALNALTVSVKTHTDADWYDIALTDPSYVIAATTGIDTLAAGSSGLLTLDVQGLYALRVTATVAAGDTVITAHGSVG